jgi:hypothetical protein
MPAHSRLILIPLLAAGLIFVGCKDTKVVSYRVPKEPDAGAQPAAAPNPMPAAGSDNLPADARVLPASGQPADGALPPGHPAIDGKPGPGDVGSAMASTPVPVAADEPLVWTAPAVWAVKKGSAMRRGSYAVSGPEGAGDVSVTAFPGDVGGNLANVNRWRGQLQLPPVSDPSGALLPLDSNGLHMLVFEGANQGSRMIGAIVPHAGATWFFKFTGPDALVAREKPAFIGFLRTVRTP